MKIREYILMVVVSALSFSSYAKEISYDFIEVSYGTGSVDTDTSAGDVDFDGFTIGGSVSIVPHLALIASYSSVETDPLFGVTAEATDLSFGVLGYTNVAPNTSIFGSFEVVTADAEATDGVTTIEDDDTGNQITGGIRHMVSDVVELAAAVTRVDVFDDTETGIGAGIRFYATNSFSLGVGYSTSSDTDTLSFNARVDFR